MEAEPCAGERRRSPAHRSVCHAFSLPRRPPAFGPDSIFARPRLERYFYYPLGPNEFASYQAATKLVSDAKCDRIGLAVDRDAPEYFVWVTVQAYVPQVRIEHTGAKNTSGILSTDFGPCAIIARPLTGRTDMICGAGTTLVRSRQRRSGFI
jgi:hypothetical protein